MKRRLLNIVLILALALSFSTATLAQQGGPNLDDTVDFGVSKSPNGIYIVQMDDDPVTDSALWSDSAVFGCIGGFGWDVFDQRQRSTGCPCSNADAVDGGVITANRGRYSLRCS